MPTNDTVSYPLSAAPSSLIVYCRAGSNLEPSTRTMRSFTAVYLASDTSMVPPGSRMVNGFALS
jgi:hypothetical protein